MQDYPEKDSWEPFRFFLGAWTGTGSGKPGESRYCGNKASQRRLPWWRSHAGLPHHAYRNDQSPCPVAASAH